MTLVQTGLVYVTLEEIIHRVYVRKDSQEILFLKKFKFS